MRLLFIDNRSFFAQGLRIVLENTEPGVRLVSCDNFDDALRLPEPEKVDLVLVDNSLPGLDKINSLATLGGCFPNAQITVTALNDSHGSDKITDVEEAVQFVRSSSTFKALSNYLFLDAKNISSGSTRQVFEHNSYETPREPEASPMLKRCALDFLTQRQREVLTQVVQGKPNKVIARALKISEHTVKAHISASFKTLGVRNRTEAVYAASKLNYQFQNEPRRYNGTALQE